MIRRGGAEVRYEWLFRPSPRLFASCCGADGTGSGGFTVVTLDRQAGGRMNLTVRLQTSETGHRSQISHETKCRSCLFRPRPLPHSLPRGSQRSMRATTVFAQSVAPWLAANLEIQRRQMVPIIFSHPLRASQASLTFLQIEPRTERAWPDAWMGNCTLHRDVSVITAHGWWATAKAGSSETGVANLRLHPSREGHGSRSQKTQRIS